jgi:four helix bundle protein
MLIATGDDLTGYDLDLYNQLGRSLGSVAANFAEGHGRCMIQDKIRFLRMARGSAYESVVHARILYVDYAQDLADIIKLAEALDAYILSVIP